MPTPLSLSALALAYGFCGVALPSCGGSEIPLGHSAQAIVGGVADQAHPSVGVLTTSEGVCTTTLVGETTALTAAHCIDGVKWARVQLGVSGDVQFSPFFEVERRLKHPDYDARAGKADLAVLRLSGGPSTVAEPSSLTSRPPTAGLPITLVGFGVSGDDKQDFGRRRAAESQIDIIQPSRFGLLVGDSAGDDTSFCSGDSGGPSFVVENGRPRLIGVHSFNIFGCRKDGWDSRVDLFAQWIHQAADGDVLFDGSYDPPQPPDPGAEDSTNGSCATGSSPSGPALPLAAILIALLVITQTRRRRDRRP